MSDLLNSASLVMIPSGYKEDTVYSEVPTNGNGDLSFTRASNGTRVNSAGLVEVTPWNLADNSNDFGGLALITKTTGQVSPIDSTSGNLLTATGSGEHYSGTASLTVVVGNSYTYSVYGKFVQNLQLALRTVFSNGDQDIATIWNLSTGALVSNAGQHTNPTITAVGNGYYRCSFTFTPTSVPAFPLLFRLQMALGGNTSFTASSGDAFLAYGAQINNGALAPYFPTTDRLNVPRLTYQNGGGGCPSLLLEKQSTNLCLWSEDFTQTDWTKSGVTISANNTTSPDGTQNADKLVSINGSTSCAIAQSINITNGAIYTYSAYVKKAGADWVQLIIVGGPIARIWVNLTNGAIGTNNGNFSSVSVDSMGNDWYRVKAIYTSSSSTVSAYVVLANGDNIDSFTGNGTSGLFAWGTQLEQSSYATSLIPTTSSSATRVADACFKTGISSLFGTNQGTFFIDLLYNGSDSGSGYLFDVTDSANTTRFLMYDSNGSGLYILYDSQIGSITTYQLTKGQRYKIGVKYNSTATTWYINGSSVATGGTFAYQMSQIYLNQRFSQTDQAEMQVNQSIVFPTALTNAELASLTTI